MDGVVTVLERAEALVRLLQTKTLSEDERHTHTRTSRCAADEREKMCIQEGDFVGC